MPGVLPGVLALVVLALAGCGSNLPAPVEDRTARTPQPQPSSHASVDTYTVQRGDTLYSIAFRYGLDFRRVAAANRIAAPYTIYAGQKIVLKEGELPPVGIPVPAARPASKPAPVAATVPKPAAPVAKPPPKSATAKPATTSTTRYTGGTVKKWRWPTSGKVTRGYTGSLHKGIDIDGNRGDPVHAVAAGKVVYAGTGIVGMGELLIIKHNEVYLSAYAHNDQLLVREGDVVSVGQKIAEKGSSGTDTVKLHFEIRKEGKPIDPQRVLPRR